MLSPCVETYRHSTLKAMLIIKYSNLFKKEEKKNNNNNKQPNILGSNLGLRNRSQGLESKDMNYFNPIPLAFK